MCERAPTSGPLICHPRRTADVPAPLAETGIDMHGNAVRIAGPGGPGDTTSGRDQLAHNRQRLGHPHRLSRRGHRASASPSIWPAALVAATAGSAIAEKLAPKLKRAKANVPHRCLMIVSLGHT